MSASNYLWQVAAGGAAEAREQKQRWHSFRLFLVGQGRKRQEDSYEIETGRE